MTKNAINILRKIYDNRKRGYVLYLDGSKILPTVGNGSMIVFDDNNELIYSLRASTNPNLQNAVNILATEYAQVFCFDMDMPLSDTNNILDEFISQGLIDEKQKEDFLSQMRGPYKPDKGGYGRLSDDKMKKIIQENE